MLNSLKNKGKKFWNIIRPRKWYGFLPIILVVGCVAIASLVLIDVSFAQNTVEVIMSPMDSFRNALVSFTGGIFLLLATKFISFTVFCLRFTIELAAYNNYIGSGAVQLGWVLVRDVANMFFVIILMLIAFGTVLGLEQYEWKKLLPKFILAAILVNFSRVICGVIIDAAHVFTMTFISGVAATAGGNLTHALNLDKVLDFTSNANPKAMDSMNILVTTMIACIFSFAALVIIAAYTFVFLARAVTLWVLIILSPLAFIFSIIPQTKSYAGQWWGEFTKNVLMAPVLAFFLWLSFAIAGSGALHGEINNNSAYGMKDSAEYNALAGKDAVENNISKFLEANNLAGFLIAFALLMAGVKVSQQLGGAGASMMAKAGGAATQFAMAASGATAAKWAGRKTISAAKSAAKATGKFALMKAPILGGDAWKRRGNRIKYNAIALAEKAGKGRDVASKGAREKILKKYGHTKWGAAAAGAAEGLIQSPGKADARVKKLKDYAEGIKKEREIVWGAGTTPEGKKAGEQLMVVKNAEEVSDNKARNALSGVRVSLLREDGKYEQADGLETQNEAENLEVIQKMTKNMSSQQMSAAAVNLSKERDNMFEEIKTKGESVKRTEELNGINERVHGLMTSAGDKGHYDYNIVLDEFAKDFQGDSQDYAQRFLTATTGKNTVIKGDDVATKKLTKEVNEAFEKSMGKKKDIYLNNMRESFIKMATTEGDLGGLASISHGRNLEDSNKPEGRQKSVLGIGSGVGQFDSEGNQRAAGSRDIGKADPDALAYFAPKVSFAKASGADALLNKNNQGNIVGWENSNFDAMISQFEAATSPVAVKRVASQSLMKDVASRATPDMQKELIIKLATRMNKKTFTEAMKMFTGVREQFKDVNGEPKIKINNLGSTSNKPGEKENVDPFFDDLNSGDPKKIDGLFAKLSTKEIEKQKEKEKEKEKAKKLEKEIEKEDEDIAERKIARERKIRDRRGSVEYDLVDFEEDDSDD